MQHRELERLSGEGERADAGEHGERHRADLEDDEQDRDAEVLDALIHQPHQRVETRQHPGAGEAGLVVQRVFDLLELSGDRAHLVEGDVREIEVEVPRELRRQPERAAE